jgi:acyl-[acyl-carrier-protein]-phospholipid O-acyltransferase / long-chain-fatty-acid--[acyl-carrier-protein] ligase
MLNLEVEDHRSHALIIHTTGASVLVSTDTFASLYARAADAEALTSLRYLVLGGEKVNQATLDLFAQKSSALVLQGYGMTECAPVIAVNQPQANQTETVGKLLPGMEARLEPVEGISIGERLWVRGPNVMKGYLDPDGSGIIKRPPNEWFDTGDLARIDEDGFITVTGRVKRFARVGAEMVSLAAVEDLARSLWPEANHGALAVAQLNNHEEIILMTDQKGAERTDLATWARTHDTFQLEVPHRVIVLRRLPLLPTGKADYLKLRRIIKKQLGDASFPTHQSNDLSGDIGKVRST